mgnify:CR=1 FL=1
MATTGLSTQNPTYIQRYTNSPSFVDSISGTYLNQTAAQADELSQNWIMRQQQIEKSGLEMNLLKQQQIDKKKQAELASEYAQKFLSQWNTAATESRGAFNTAMAGVEETKNYLKSIGTEYGGQIKALVDQTQADLAQYKQTYAPLETEAIETARQALGSQRGMMTYLQDFSKADYEGVSGRAKADVGAEMEMGRRAEARELSGLGLDPTDTKYRGSMRQSRVDEAINKALAANKARLEEKNRVTGVTTTGLQVIDPSKMGGNIAGQIQTGKKGYTDTVSELTKAGAGLQTGLAGAKASLAKTSGDLATGYGQTMMPQYGESFMSMLGTGMATDPTKLSGLNA